MKADTMNEKKPYPNTEAGVRALFAEHSPPFEVERVEQLGRNIWAAYFADGSGTRVYPEFGHFEQPPISHLMETLGPMRDPESVIAFVGKHGSSARRPLLVSEWAFQMPSECGKVFWRVVTACWNGFDRIPHDDYEQLFEMFSDSVPSCDVPEGLTVFRGQDADAEKGLSWTRDRKVAEAFAHGHRGLNNPNPVVLEMEVFRGDVAFTCNERDEAEVVLMRIPD